MSFPLPTFTKPRNRNVVVRPSFSSVAQRATLTPARIRALSPAAWFRFNKGITVTGAGVSTWADQSGNGRDLLQGTDTNRPALQTDGSILFDGVDNHLKCSAFTLNQPITIYILFKAISWAASDRIYDGNTASSVALFQTGSTPQINIFAGTAVGQISPVLGAYAVVSSVFNGASSLNQLNTNAAVTGNAGANNAAGFTLASTGVGNWGNIQVKEVIIFPSAHDAVMRARVNDYLTRYVGLT